MSYYIVSEELDIENEHVVALFNSVEEANGFVEDELRKKGFEKFYDYPRTPYKDVGAWKIYPVNSETKEVLTGCGYTVYKVRGLFYE